MKVGVELYVHFSLSQREFRFFVPVWIQSLDGHANTAIATSLAMQIAQRADTIVNLGNDTVVKNRDPYFELTPGVMRHIKSIPLTDYDDVVEHAEAHFTSGTIGEFRGEYRFLSNFYPAEFVYQGILWPNSEAAYQAMKSHDRGVHMMFSRFSNPAHAKREGRLIKPIRSDWDDVKVSIMRDIVYAKFRQNPELKHKLLATGNAILQEGNLHNDRVWGVCPPYSNKGENHLGKILMDVRREIDTISY